MATAKKTSTDLSYATSLGLMYRRFVLDCISDLGYAVSQDCFYRPQYYQDLPVGIVKSMGILQASMGTQPDLPDRETRAMLYNPIFGNSDVTGTGNDGSAYQAGRLKLIASATAFSERTQAAGFLAVRERVMSSLVSPIDHFKGIVGASFTESDHRTNALFELSMKIITDTAVRGIFGINKAPDLEFSNSEAAKLVQRISEQLQDLIPSGRISREKFTEQLRMAKNGKEAIELMLNPDVLTGDEGLLDTLIPKVYAWGSDLGLVGGGSQQPGRV